VARRIQQASLPKEVPEVEGWQIAHHYQPAREVGGDFYDFLELPNGRLGIVVGDATGKGRPAGDRGARSDSKEVWEQGPKSECPSRTPMAARIRPKRRCVRMKALIGVDPHKGSVAVAVVDEAVGELLESASFLQNRAGLRALERFKRNDTPSVALSGGKRRRSRGRHLAGRLAAAGESVVDVTPKLSAPVRVLSSGNARKNDGLDALASALAASRNERLAPVDPEAESEALRLLSERREDLVAERTRALKAASTASTRPRPRWDSRNALGPPSGTHPARHTTPGPLVASPPPTSFGDLARPADAGSKDHGPQRAHRGRGRGFRHHPH
jgi:Transposase